MEKDKLRELGDVKMISFSTNRLLTK